MSVSKLESLPNEVLADLLEKYINGIDILNAFAFQLNRRFDALITQCQRFRFDFMRCHKDHFRLCIGLLPAYINKIEELALSEQNTPGQIHAFLSFFPSFTLFKRLRKLYLHINAEAVEPVFLGNAFHSLSGTTLDTLSIKITNIHTIYSFQNIIIKIFCMKTLKQFSIVCDPCEINWELLNDVSSNIEYLTIDGILCKCQDLKYIFRCLPDLKYLNINLTSVDFSKNNKSTSSSENAIVQMSMLHTVIFKISQHDETTPTVLGPYLRAMPSLHRLEIKTQNGFHGISMWETLLETLLPTLTYFNVDHSAFYYRDVYLDALESIQTPFWIKKINFHIVIKHLLQLDSNGLYSDDRYDYGLYGSKNVVDRWWMGPQRKLRDNWSPMDTISSLKLTTEYSFFLRDYYLDKVNQLVVYDFDDNLLELLTTHVNCSQIKHLDVSFLKEDSNKISTLLECTRSVISVRIKWNQLLDGQFANLKRCKNIKFVDISPDQHSFDKKHIVTISHMFPNLEHLVISTQDLRNVPMLQTYLPRLRSLTFGTSAPKNLSLFDDNEQNMGDENLQGKSELLFQRRGNWITIWIDEAALQDSNWKITNPNSEQSSDDSWFNKIFGKLCSVVK